MSTPNNNHHHHHLLRPPPPPPPHHHHRAGGGGGTTAAGTTRPFVLVPLYIYPAPQAWAPLYEAAAAHPDLDFLVVVNPANGPGAGSLPDANYVEALARLTAARNVRVIGYVHCSYGKRLAEDVVADVEAYGRWEGEMGRVREGEKVSPFFFFLPFAALLFFFFLGWYGVCERCVYVGGREEQLHFFCVVQTNFGPVPLPSPPPRALFLSSAPQFLR